MFNLTINPEVFQIIKLSEIGSENMNHYIAVVYYYPLAISNSIRRYWLTVMVHSYLFNNIVSNSCGLRRSFTLAYYKVEGRCSRDLSQIYGANR